MEYRSDFEQATPLWIKFGASVMNTLAKIEPDEK